MRYINKLALPCLYQIKSLLLSHHHSTSALVSEILMSVLQTVQKTKQQTIYIWTDSAKNNKQFTYGQTVQKNSTGAFTVLQTVQKKQQQFTHGQTVQKNCTGAFTVLQTVQKTKQNKKYNLHMVRQCNKTTNNLHMDSTYLQTVQKTMFKIHIHILSTHMALFHCMVRYGSAQLGTVRYGSVRVGLHFHRSLVPL